MSSLPPDPTPLTSTRHCSSIIDRLQQLCLRVATRLHLPSDTDESAKPFIDGQSDGGVSEGMFSRMTKRKGGDMSTVFVHAGAGFHSTQNEATHLQACSDAAAMAMRMLKEGCSAVDAVEMAIKVLEDRKITNAGYGSNLCIDGVVECDATVVDQYGRSGAVGAVSQIRNPISLARLILSRSLQPLSLRRVPPNLLVSDGARDFAEEHGMLIIPHDALVSEVARDRWIQWKRDLDKEERHRGSSPNEARSDSGSAIDPEPDSSMVYEEQARKRSRAEHTFNMYQLARLNSHVTALKPPSSPAPSLALSDADTPQTSSSPERGTGLPQSPGSIANLLGSGKSSQSPSADNQRGIKFQTRTAVVPSPEQMESITTDTDGFWQHDGPSSDSASSSSGSLRLPSASPSPPPYAELRAPHAPSSSIKESENLPLRKIRQPTASLPSKTATSATPFDDHITDTVGAIAVDRFGNIAAGSSSGGIGMKHRGRVGPAALVGIGTAVIPGDPADKEHTTVATVCSGTGEHMATTTAATTCAQRVYDSVRRQSPGKLEVCEEGEALESMIQKDFMEHPSVKQSTSAGALGILAVKKTRSGIYFYFAHNTDSFALASMHSDETKPAVCMSRNKGPTRIARGARAIRFKRRA